MIKRAAPMPFSSAQKEQASAAPLPDLAVELKPAPGQTGPKGLAPRTNYSRVNTGSPPASGVGLEGRSMPPDAMRMLPEKVASGRAMEMTPRMTIQQMIKAAAEGVASRTVLSQEAVRQLGLEEKTASAGHPDPKSTDQSISTAYAEKLASAVEYLAVIEKEAEGVAEAGSVTKNGPGEGPNALEVTQATSSETNVDAGELGQATSQHVPPKDPPTESASGTNGPSNAMETNEDMQHPEQPVDPMGNEKSSSIAGLIRKVAAVKSQAPVEDFLQKIKAAGAKVKVAEDAINPAQISAGSAVPPDASASEENVPSQPSDVSSQERMVSSNDAAIDYTKRDAKADPKSDVNKLLEEPALTSSTDSTLDKTLDHTDEAGAKISSAMKIAAARALLLKLAQQIEEKPGDGKKEKKSMGGMGTYQAPPVGGVGQGAM